MTPTSGERAGRAPAAQQKVYAARIRGEVRPKVAVRVRQRTVDDLAAALEFPHVAEVTQSQLLRRYIAEGLAADKARDAGST